MVTTSADSSQRHHWSDRWLAWRDRLLTSPRFRRWAAVLPFTRPIARRRARELFDLCAGFVYTQVLLACVRLDLFDKLAAGPQTAAELAPHLGLDETAATRLLRAAASLRLAERRRGQCYGLGPLGAAMIDNPGIVAMVEHHAMLYADLHDPVALLRGTRSDTELGRYWSYARSDTADALADSQIKAYTELMAASQPLVAAEILAAYRLDRHRCLLDVGGGNGAFLAAVAKRYPRLPLMLFDLPPVAEQARERFTRDGLSERATVFGGDLRSDPLPHGADVISLVRVIHDHNDDIALCILRAVRRALPEDGVLLLAEPMSDTPGAEPIGDAYFGFYLLAMGQGRPRTPDEIKCLLNQSGFVNCRLLATQTPMLARVMVARPDKATVKKNSQSSVNQT